MISPCPDNQDGHSFCTSCTWVPAWCDLRVRHVSHALQTPETGIRYWRIASRCTYRWQLEVSLYTSQNGKPGAPVDQSALKSGFKNCFQISLFWPLSWLWTNTGFSKNLNLHAKISDNTQQTDRAEDRGPKTYKLVGSGRTIRPYASRTCLFRLINMQNGALRSPAPPSQLWCSSLHHTLLICTTKRLELSILL